MATQKRKKLTSGQVVCNKLQNKNRLIMKYLVFIFVFFFLSFANAQNKEFTIGEKKIVFVGDLSSTKVDADYIATEFSLKIDGKEYFYNSTGTQEFLITITPHEKKLLIRKMVLLPDFAIKDNFVWQEIYRDIFTFEGNKFSTQQIANQRLKNLDKRLVKEHLDEFKKKFVQRKAKMGDTQSGDIESVFLIALNSPKDADFFTDYKKYCPIDGEYAETFSEFLDYYDMFIKGKKISHEKW